MLFLNKAMLHGVIYVQRKGFKQTIDHLFSSLFLMKTKVLIMFGMLFIITHESAL